MKPGSEPSSETSSEQASQTTIPQDGDADAAVDKLEGDTPDPNSIEGLLALDDGALMEIMGMKRQVAQVRQDLKEMTKLKGEARKLAEQKVERLLTPSVSENSFRYALEDAQREARSKSAKAAYADDSPTSVI